MIFVPYYKLKEGMKVGNDISVAYTEKSEAFLLKRGTILTKNNIDKLSNFNISGVYIDDGRKNLILDDDLRRESVLTVKKIFDSCGNTHVILNENTLKQIGEQAVRKRFHAQYSLFFFRCTDKIHETVRHIAGLHAIMPALKEKGAVTWVDSLRQH